MYYRKERFTHQLTINDCKRYILDWKLELKYDHEDSFRVLNVEGKPFGERRLLGDALQASKLNPAPGPFVNYIANSVKTYMGDAEPVDDLAMVAIRYK